MPGKLLFIHGTETRDVTGAKRQITERAQRILGWSPDQIVALEWGRTVGPPDLDITGALPHEYVTRGLAEELSEAGQMAAMWDLLFADPFVELRLLAVTFGQDSGGIWINSALASEEVQRRLKALSLPPEILDRAKLAEADVADAAELLSNSHELTDAAEPLSSVDAPHWDRLISLGLLQEITPAEAVKITNEKWVDPLLGLAGAYACLAQQMDDYVNTVLKNLDQIDPALPDVAILFAALDRRSGVKSDAVHSRLEKILGDGSVPLFGWGVAIGALAASYYGVNELAEKYQKISQTLVEESIWTLWVQHD